MDSVDNFINADDTLKAMINPRRSKMEGVDWNRKETLGAWKTDKEVAAAKAKVTHSSMHVEGDEEVWLQ